MSTKTTNYEFIKPEKTDPADITATNENWDKLDEALRKRRTDLSMDGNRITDVAEPESRHDVATRGFVEDFSLEGSTYVAVDEKNDGNVILRPYVPLVDDPADYIVEQGVKNNWTYRKWNSGIAECWCLVKSTDTPSWSDSQVVAQRQLPFYLHRHDSDFVINVSGYQEGIIESYITTAVITESNGNTIASAYMKCLNQSYSEHPCYFNFNIKGRWK